MNIQLRKRLYTSQSGYQGLHIPKAIANQFGCEVVDLIWDGNTLIIMPVREDS
jgi:virulence-associated protein VagC